MTTTKDNRTIQPYLFFNGNCEEAIECYRKALGGEVEMMMRFKESPEPQPPGTVPPGFDNKIMHASFRVGQTTVMASDGSSAGKASFQGFSLSLSVPSEKEVDRVFAALADGGQSASATNQNLLFAALRHARRPVRRRMDDWRCTSSTKVSAAI